MTLGPSSYGGPSPVVYGEFVLTTSFLGCEKIALGFLVSCMGPEDWPDWSQLIRKLWFLGSALKISCHVPVYLGICCKKAGGNSLEVCPMVTK